MLWGDGRREEGAEELPGTCERKSRRMEKIPGLKGQEAFRVFTLQEGEKQGSRVVGSVVRGSRTRIPDLHVTAGLNLFSVICGEWYLHPKNGGEVNEARHVKCSLCLLAQSCRSLLTSRVPWSCVQGPASPQAGSSSPRIA